LGGYLVGEEPEKWEVVKFPAIKEGEPTEDDPRNKGEALWESRHSLEKLEGIRKKNQIVFENLYQQDPQPEKGRLYSNLMTWDKLPDDKRQQVHCYIDTADTGSDYLCAVAYVKSGRNAFIVDVVYTKDPAEITEPLVTEMLIRNKVTLCHIESNAGGRSYGRNIMRLVKEKGYEGCQFNLFTQSKNKEVRIFTNSSAVSNLLFFPEYWHSKYPTFHKDVTGYMKEGKNEHDDAPDVLTGIVEKSGQAEIYVG